MGTAPGKRDLQKGSQVLPEKMLVSCQGFLRPQLHLGSLQAFDFEAELLHNRGVSARFEPLQVPCITPELQIMACNPQILYGLTAHHAFLPACGLVGGPINSRRAGLHIN